MNANACKPQYKNQPWKTLINLKSKFKTFQLLILRIASVWKQLLMAGLGSPNLEKGEWNVVTIWIWVDIIILTILQNNKLQKNFLHLNSLTYKIYNINTTENTCIC